MEQGFSGTLRSALGAAVLVALIIGLILIIGPDRASNLLFSSPATMFGFDQTTLLRVIGADFLVFAAGAAFVASRRIINLTFVKAIVVVEFAILVAIIAALAFVNSAFTEFGRALLVEVATVTGVIAVTQLIGAFLLYQGSSRHTVRWQERELFVRMSRFVAAPVDVAWSVMTDHVAYAEYAKNLAGVEILEGDGLGMIRKCTDVDGGSWTEEATIWEPMHRFGFEIDTDAKDYPYPLESLYATWSVEPAGSTGVLVSIQFSATPMRGLKGKLFGLMGQYVFPKVLDDILCKWKAEMESRSNSDFDLENESVQRAAVAPIRA